MLYYFMGSPADTVPRKNENVVSRKIAGEFVLVPISRQAEDVDSIYTLNETGSRIWELIDGKRKTADIRDEIVAEFEVSTEAAGADIAEFLKRLEGIGAVKTV